MNTRLEMFSTGFLETQLEVLTKTYRRYIFLYKKHFNQFYVSPYMEQVPPTLIEKLKFYQEQNENLFLCLTYNKIICELWSNQ